jgi:hypothetical protein
MVDLTTLFTILSSLSECHFPSCLVFSSYSLTPLSISLVPARNNNLSD